MKKVNMILALDDNNWIGKKWDLAWKISADMKYFKKITSQTKDLSKFNAVIMWKNTWESIPQKFRPLPDRVNCILSRSINFESVKNKIDDFVLYFNSIDTCIDTLIKRTNIENIFVIWWANIYNQFLNHPRLDKIYVTKVEWNFSCDVFFDWITKDFELESVSDIQEENWIKFRFQVYKKILN